MNRELFFAWLHRVDDYIARTEGRKILLLVDNASVHGSEENHPVLSNVHLHFLPKNTTAILQPLDAGVIACVKKRYQKKQIERGIDLIEQGNLDSIYNVDLKSAME